MIDSEATQKDNLLINPCLCKEMKCGHMASKTYVMVSLCNLVLYPAKHLSTKLCLGGHPSFLSLK